MRVVIWGGSTGMGEALAKRYFVLGHDVIVLSRHPEHFQANFSGQFSRIQYYQADITDKSQVEDRLKTILSGGHIDIYIICAGLGLEDKSDIENFEVSEKIINTNINGTLYAVSAVFDKMKQNGEGHIVLFGSLAGIRGLPGNSAYCASKSAIHSMGQSWGSAWKKYGIHVTTIAPGFIRTPHTQDNTHKMPYMMSATDAAELIEEAIKKKKSFYAFPLKPYIFMKLLSILPTGISNMILRKYKIYKKDEE